MRRDITKLKHDKNLYGLINILSEGDATSRSLAAEALGEVKDEVGAEYLIQALADEEWTVRRNAAWALGEIQSKRAIPYLIAAFSTPRAGIDAYCAEALIKIGSAAVRALIRALRNHDPNVRYWSISALGEIGDQRATEALIILLSDEDVIVRYATIKALGELEDSRALKSMVRALEDPSDMIRRLAEKSIHRVLSSTIARSARTERIIELIAVVEADDGSVRTIEVDLHKNS
ncbi:MAG: HEAT repeat domain-containing protein [Halobacteriota archaeon]